MAATKRRLRLLIQTLEAREVPSATTPQLLYDINSGVGDSNPSGFAAVVNTVSNSPVNGVVFTASDGITTGLYYSDKTPNNSPTLINVAPATTAGSAPVTFKSAAYFGGGAGTDKELYVTDGISGTATLIKDIIAGSGGSDPQLLTNLNDNVLYFVATDSANGRELYKSTGAVGNASIVQNLSSGNASTAFDSLHAVNGTLYAVAKSTTDTNWQIYSVNGPGNLMTNVGGLSNGLTPIANSYIIGGTDLYFAASNGSNDYRVYRLNTTTNALVQLFQTNQPSFAGTGSPLAYMGGNVYFASTTVANGAELFRSNGTANSGAVYADILAGSSGSNPQNIVAVNDEIYFAATVGGKKELYVTDGLAAPALAANGTTNASSSDPAHLTVVSGQLVFEAKNSGGANSLFIYDPLNKPAPFPTELQTAGSTVFTNFGAFTAIGDSLYLAMSDGTSGKEPFIFDPIPDSPVFDGSISPDTGFASIPATLADNVTNDTGLTTMTGRADAAGQTITIYNGAVALGTTTSGANGHWSFSYGFGVGQNTVSTFTLTAKATDVSGQQSGSSVTPLTLTIDTLAPPTPSITGNDQFGNTLDTIPGDTNPTLDNTLTIKGTASTTAGSEADYVNLFINPSATPINPVPIAVNQTTGIWQFDTSTLADGTYQFYAEALDKATNRSGDTGSNYYTVTIDTTSPLAPVITGFIDNTDPQNPVTLTSPTNFNTPTLTGTAEAFSLVSIYDNGVLKGTVTADVNGNWLFLVPAALSDGSHPFTATASDSLNPPSPFSATSTIVIDTTAPTTPTIDLTFTPDSGVAGDFITNANGQSGPLILGGTAEIGSTVTIRDNGNILGTAVANASGRWSYAAGSPGTPLPEGANAFTVSAIDAALNTSGASSPLNIVIDSINPTPGFTSFSPNSGSSNSDFLTNATTLTLTGTAEAGAVVTVKEGLTTLGTPTATAGGVWTLNNVSAPAGAHNYTATSVDVAGNFSSNSLIIPTITVDTTRPGTPTVSATFSTDTGTLGDRTTSDTTLTFTGTAEVGATVTIKDGGIAVGTSAPAAANGSWTVTTSALSAGLHNQLTAVATDAAGNDSLTSATIAPITIDTTTPTAPVINATISSDTGNGTPATLTDLITSSTSFDLTGTITLGENVLANGVIISDNGTPLNGSAIIALDGVSWTFTTPPLAAGIHVFKATARNAVGNVSPDSLPLTVTVDTGNPATPALTGFTTDSGAVGDNLTNDTTPTFNGTILSAPSTAEDGTIITVRDVTSGSTVLGTATVSGGAWSFPITSALSAGAHTFTFTATDLAGNLSSSSNTTITIDADITTPTITGISPDSDVTGVPATQSDRITNEDTITVSGTADIGTKVELFDGVVSVAVIPATAAATWTTGSLTFTEGVHHLTVVSTDPAGNTDTSAVVDITIDTVGPATPVFVNFTDDTGVSGDGLTSDTTPTFNGTGVEDGTVIVILENGTPIANATVTGGTWAAPVTSPLSEGLHTFTATASDLAGNPAPGAPAIPSITIDTTAPATPTIDGFVPVTPANAPAYGLTTTATVITLSGSAGEAGLSIKVFDGLTDLTPTPLVSGPGGVWTLPNVTVGDGPHNFTASTTDAAGNLSPASAALTISVESSLVVDKTLPEDSKTTAYLVSDLLANHPITDTSKGIAITSLVGSGVWSYSTKAKTFVTINPGPLSDAHALLLRDIDSLTFTPAKNFTGVARITVHAWDQSGGQPGEFGDASVNGGTTAFSTTTEEITLGVTNVNDAPTLTLADSPLFPSVTAPAPSVASVAALLSGRFHDIDPSAKPGLAVTAISGTGTWQFQVTGAPGWTTITAPSAAKAVVLDQTYLIRFVPANGFKGVAKLTYKAWDGSTAVLPGTTGVKTTGDTAFGATTEIATVNVGNTAPHFVVPPPPAPALLTFPALTEDPKTNPGVTVTTLLKGRTTDIEQKTAGLAVTGVTTAASGKWQYSKDGKTWGDITGAGATHVLLLSGSYKIRFLPDANTPNVNSGPGSTVTPTITFRAWDGTAGLAGDWADPTGNTAFSTASLTATVSLKGVNDAPVLVTTGTPLLPDLTTAATFANTAGTAVSTLINGSLTDNETSQASIGISVVGTKGTGTWQFNKTSGAATGVGTWTNFPPVTPDKGLLLLPTYFVRFVPTSGVPAQLASLSFKGWDKNIGVGGFAADSKTLDLSTATETAYVSVGNTPPTLAATVPALAGFAEDPKANPGTAVKGLLTGNVTNPAPIVGEGSGIAVTAVDNTNGTWQYALKSTFVNIPTTVSPTNALLLPDSAKLKFVPNPDFNGTINALTYKAWDRSVGTDGNFADTTTNSAFSPGTVSPSLTITPVNDRPVVAVGTPVLLAPISLGDANPAGDTVSSLVAAPVVTEPGDELVLDPLRGIAVTGITGAGTWQYSSNNGSSWTNITAPTTAKALLLDPSWKVRFLASAPGTAQTASITFRAWDQSNIKNVAGATANAGLAADTSFSLGSLTATVSIGNTAPGF